MQIIPALPLFEGIARLRFPIMLPFGLSTLYLRIILLCLLKLTGRISTVGYRKLYLSIELLDVLATMPLRFRLLGRLFGRFDLCRLGVFVDTRFLLRVLSIKRNLGFFGHWPYLSVVRGNIYRMCKRWECLSIRIMRTTAQLM